MKKRIVSTLLALCMLLCLVPTAAFAEDNTENPPVCSCETACTAESMNADCPVCGAEGALPESCEKCAQPKGEVSAPQPEEEVSDPQPETALTALSGEGETPAASGAVTDVSTAADLTAAISNPDVNTVRLAANIDISNTLTVNRTVTLDLNGYALTVGGTELDIFSVDESGNLTVKDSGTGGKIDGQNKNCGFCIYGGVLTLESGTITNCTTVGDGGAVDISSGNSEGVYGKFVMNGGAITNCKATDDSGAVDIGSGCTFIMNSGTISGCSVDDEAGAIFIKGNATFLMNGGTIENCSAGKNGGAVKMRSTSRFTMNGGTISSCTAQKGGGVYVDGSSTFTMNGGSIANCTAVNGGNSVFVVNPSASFTMTDGTVDGSIRLSYSVGNNTVYMDGLGTKESPYEIGTADQLKLFRDIVNGTDVQTPNPGACAVLTNDIILNDGTFDANGTYTPGSSGKAVETWTPIAYSGPFTVDTTLYYTGTFDGQGHAIKGMYVSINDAPSIEDQVCLGLFSTAKNAVIRNVTVTGYVSGYAGNLGGIVGYLAGGTIENCANYCTVTDTLAAHEVTSYVGGIAGAVNCSAAIRDCYNTGKLTEYVFVKYHKTGGIVGYIGSSAVSNCYNVGKVAGKGWYNGEIIGFIAGEDAEETPSTINNCYYLNTTNKAVGNDADTVTNTGPKTAVQFGNGTVLALLINGRADSAHPWNSQCKYLAAAGRTLPVFKTQTGDAHTHDWSAWTSNGDGTHSRRCTCNAVETVNCSGGKATCKDKAICEICGDSYGGLDANNHTDLKHIDAKAATVAEEGNIEYWYCGGCKKYFSDAAAKTEITKADTVAAKLPPKITAGDGATVTQGEKKELSFTSDASFADFIRVELDGNTLEEKNYTKKEGSTIITLNRDFVAALSVGEHTLAIVSQSGTATAKFTVKAKPTETATPQPTVEPQPTAQPRQTAQPKPTVQPTVQPVSPIPRTGDAANPALWFALLIVSGSALAAIFVLRRKANHK